ncbi:unnamed protein product [Polarella glacialis]|uniref:Ion transport domain-containing protein n=1 Tax=Polarella glacialis TaxID=89957 RepID=A0A813KW60_POLGL|nr:unnamed protein product [Polarella glacialis]
MHRCPGGERVRRSKDPSSLGICTSKVISYPSASRGSSDATSCSSSEDENYFACQDSVGEEDSFHISSRTRCELLRLRVWMFLDSSAGSPPALRHAARIYQAVIGILLVGLIVLDTPSGVLVTFDGYWYTEVTVTVIWCLELLLRTWSNVKKPMHQTGGTRKHCCRNLPQLPLLLDVLSILALVIDLWLLSDQEAGNSPLRMLRLLTLCRLERYWCFFQPVCEVLWLEVRPLGATLGIALNVLLVSAVIMFYIESPTNEGFSSVADSLWWATTALTTVGYGDVYPKSPLGRFIGCVLAFIGIGLFALPAGILASGFREVVRRTHTHRRKADWAVWQCPPASLDAGQTARLLDALAAQVEARMDAHMVRLAAHIGKLDEHMGNLGLRMGSLQHDLDSLKTESHFCAVRMGHSPP